MTALAKRVFLEGVVQGVGFRPFIYQLAKRFDILGYVRNTKSGVEILAVGREDDLNNFVEGIKKDPPPLSIIKNIVIEEIGNEEVRSYQSFIIEASLPNEEKAIFISPDAAICKDCRDDFFDKGGRYYNYPFVNCTNCGPRFSIITDYPYDRANTTMNAFPMCPSCRAEYEDINSRRYHAEPVACSICGPRYRLLDSSFKEVAGVDAFETARYLLKVGRIIAVKGVGGYHLVADAKNKEAIRTLRSRKVRDTKPFAVMARDRETVENYCHLSQKELSILEGKESPILLLRQKSGALDEELRALIAGRSPYLGVLLPYAPYQYLLLEDFELLIFTSGNISGEPIVYRDEELGRLSAIADYFLVHNREIVRFVEDSVVKVLNVGETSIPLLMRKSRGYAPSPLFLPKESDLQILGLGGDLKSTISFIKGDVLTQSQYLGDLGDYLSFRDYKKTISDFIDFYALDPHIFVCDAHPSYFSSHYAEELAKGEKRLLKVQHHKAHVAAVALERGWLYDTFIGVALDGTGYGDDGAIWGSEVFLGSLREGFERVGHLSYTAFPFGDVAVKEPEKSALSYLSYYDLLDDELLCLFSEKTGENIRGLQGFIKEGKIFTSSTGRLFDAVSFLLGFKRKIGYEGEAAIELENLIYQDFSIEEECGFYDYEIVERDGRLLIDTASILRGVIKDFRAKMAPSLISIRFHYTLVTAFMEIIRLVRAKSGVNKVALSGGSFQNSYLLYHFAKRLSKEGFIWAINSYSPPNDACISVGQCAIALFTR